MFFNSYHEPNETVRQGHCKPQENNGKAAELQQIHFLSGIATQIRESYEEINKSSKVLNVFSFHWPTKMKLETHLVIWLYDLKYLSCYIGTRG